jgi:hypothetical protein
MRGDMSPIPNTLSWRGAQLKHSDNFTFMVTFYNNTETKYLQLHPKLTIIQEIKRVPRPTENTSSNMLKCYRVPGSVLR